jgi:hypothetical protein
MREDIGEQLRAAAELGRLERESQHLAHSIIDTATELRAALAERDRNATPTRSLEDIRRDAQAAWLASRADKPALPERDTVQERTLDLSGDLAAARRDAREQWLAQRDAKTATPSADANGGRGREPTAPKLILPDGAHTL